jgi:hypothetical protein
VQLLGGPLRDAVDVDRRHGMVLVDRQIAGMPEDLAGRRVDDNCLGSNLPKQLQERELAACVHVEVEQRARHRLDVADLTGEVEHHVRVHSGVAHDVCVADVSFDYLDALRHALEVVEIRTVGRDARVHHRDVGAAFDERPRHVRAHEAQPAGDQTPSAGKRRKERGVQSDVSLVVASLAPLVRPGKRCSRRRVSRPPR